MICSAFPIRPLRALTAAVLLASLSLATPSLPTAMASDRDDLQSELEQLRARLRHIERSEGIDAEQPPQESGEPAVESPESEEPAAVMPRAPLPAWTEGLTSSQRRLLIGTLGPVSFHADDAPSPEECLKALRAAVKQSDDFDEIAPFLDRKARRRYLLTEGHADYEKHRKTDEQWIAPLLSVFGGVVRIDGTVFDDEHDDRAQVLAWVKKGNSYGLFRIEYRGEGKLWRVAGYQLEKTLGYLPPAPVKEQPAAEPTVSTDGGLTLSRTDDVVID